MLLPQADVARQRRKTVADVMELLGFRKDGFKRHERHRFLISPSGTAKPVLINTRAIISSAQS